MNAMNTMTPDEINDAIRAHLAATMPAPVGGFESSDDADAHRDQVDAEFMRLVWLSDSELAAIIG